MDRPCPIDYDPKTCNNHKQRDKQTLFINRVKSEYTMDDTAFWTCGLTFTWFYIPSLKFVKLKSLNQVTFPPQQNKGLIELFFRFYSFSKFVPSRGVQGPPGTIHGCANTYNLNSALKHKILPRSLRVISELQWGKIQNTIKGLT